MQPLAPIARVERGNLADAVGVVIDRTHSELKGLLSQLPSLSSDERKAAILMCIDDQRNRYLKLYEILAWVRKARAVTECGRLIDTALQTGTSIWEAQQWLLDRHNEFKMMAKPMYEIPTAVEMLCTGNYKVLPKSIEMVIPPPKAEGIQQERLVRQMEMNVASMLLKADLPQGMTFQGFDRGHASVQFSGVYEATLSLAPAPTVYIPPPKDNLNVQDDKQEIKKIKSQPMDVDEENNAEEEGNSHEELKQPSLYWVLINFKLLPGFLRFGPLLDFHQLQACHREVDERLKAHWYRIIQQHLKRIKYPEEEDIGDKPDTKEKSVKVEQEKLSPQDARSPATASVSQMTRASASTAKPPEDDSLELPEYKDLYQAGASVPLFHMHRCLSDIALAGGLHRIVKRLQNLVGKGSQWHGHAKVSKGDIFHYSVRISFWTRLPLFLEGVKPGPDEVKPCVEFGYSRGVSLGFQCDPVLKWLRKVEGDESGECEENLKQSQFVKVKFDLSTLNVEDVVTGAMAAVAVEQLDFVKQELLVKLGSQGDCAKFYTASIVIDGGWPKLCLNMFGGPGWILELNQISGKLELQMDPNSTFLSEEEVVNTQEMQQVVQQHMNDVWTTPKLENPGKRAMETAAVLLSEFLVKRLRAVAMNDLLAAFRMENVKVEDVPPALLNKWQMRFPKLSTQVCKEELSFALAPTPIPPQLVAAARLRKQIHGCQAQWDNPASLKHYIHIDPLKVHAYGSAPSEFKLTSIVCNDLGAPLEVVSIENVKVNTQTSSCQIGKKRQRGLIEGIDENVSIQEVHNHPTLEANKIQKVKQQSIKHNKKLQQCQQICAQLQNTSANGHTLSAILQSLSEDHVQQLISAMTMQQRNGDSEHCNGTDNGFDIQSAVKRLQLNGSNEDNRGVGLQNGTQQYMDHSEVEEKLIPLFRQVLLSRDSNCQISEAILEEWSTQQRFENEEQALKIQQQNRQDSSCSFNKNQRTDKSQVAVSAVQRMIDSSQVSIQQQMNLIQIQSMNLRCEWRWQQDKGCTVINIQELLDGSPLPEKDVNLPEILQQKCEANFNKSISAGKSQQQQQWEKSQIYQQRINKWWLEDMGIESVQIRIAPSGGSQLRIRSLYLEVIRTLYEESKCVEEFAAVNPGVQIIFTGFGEIQLRYQQHLSQQQQQQYSATDLTILHLLQDVARIKYTRNAVFSILNMLIDSKQSDSDTKSVSSSPLQLTQQSVSLGFSQMLLDSLTPQKKEIDKIPNAESTSKKAGKEFEFNLEGCGKCQIRSFGMSNIEIVVQAAKISENINCSLQWVRFNYQIPQTQSNGVDIVQIQGGAGCVLKTGSKLPQGFLDTLAHMAGVGSFDTMLDALCGATSFQYQIHAVFEQQDHQAEIPNLQIQFGDCDNPWRAEVRLLDKKSKNVSAEIVLGLSGLDFVFFCIQGVLGGCKEFRDQLGGSLIQMEGDISNVVNSERNLCFWALRDAVDSVLQHVIQMCQQGVTGRVTSQ